MTNGTDRLDRIERLVEANSAAIAELRASQQNSCETIDARLDRLATAVQDERIQRAEDYNELRGAIADTNQTVAQMARAMGQFSQTVGQLSQTVDQLSEDVRSLTAEMDQLRAMMMTHLREQHGDDGESEN
ncbi:MAG: hypothetical protein AAGF98_13025 [Cyanobacteria bacterium P01_H01_bin.153]